MIDGMTKKNKKTDCLELWHGTSNTDPEEICKKNGLDIIYASA